MWFNPDSLKQTPEVIFTPELQKLDYPSLLFNESSVEETSRQKQLGMLLDFTFDF